MLLLLLLLLSRAGDCKLLLHCLTWPLPTVIMARNLVSGAFWLSLAAAVSALPDERHIVERNAGGDLSSVPSVTLNNTVFVGRSLPEFDQELFLGIKFADEPVRFTPSTLKSAYSANDSDSGLYASGVDASGAVLYNATEYGYDCPGYGSDNVELAELGWAKFGENCMNLNVVRPKRGSDELLPVMIWIFGGGWMEGATADPR